MAVGRADHEVAAGKAEIAARRPQLRHVADRRIAALDERAEHADRSGGNRRYGSDAFKMKAALLTLAPTLDVCYRYPLIRLSDNKH
jgi:hypothetical protein